MGNSKVRQRFREILSSDHCTAVAPIFDSLSARIAEIVGWEVCKLSGSVAKAANLGFPDEIRLANVTDLSGLCQRISRIAEVSLIVDADDGGETTLEVRRTVQELEAAGATAIEIEDNVVPSRFGLRASRHALMISKDDQIMRLKAAVAARQDHVTAIIARTATFSELTFDEALTRVADYSRAGVDAIMLPRMPPRGRTDIAAISGVSDLPLCVLGLPEDCVDDESFLAAHRIRVRYLAQSTYRIAVKAIYDTLKYLIDGGNQEALRDREASPELLRAVTRVSELSEWQKLYGVP